MGFLAVVGQAAYAYPALLPLALISIGLTLWACDRKRWMCATAIGILGCAACLLYVAGPAEALSRQGDPAVLAATGPEPHPAAKGGSVHALRDPGRFSSAVRLHPRFPQDFPVPRVFRLESNSGGVRGGNLTVRFRFTGEAANAVCDLRTEGRRKGWNVEVLAPHRMIFRKDGRAVEAWFSFPARSVVLDIPDTQ